MLDRLRADDSALAERLAGLCARHEEALTRAPGQLLLQLEARLGEDDTTRAWLAAARAELASAPLRLRSSTLLGERQPELWARSLHGQLVHGLVPLPDGETVLSAGEDGRLLRWSLQGGEPVELEGPVGPINHLCLSPDGRRLATAGDDRRVGIWTLPKLESPVWCEGHEHYVRQVAFWGERVVSVSQDGSARVWEADGSCRAVLEHGQDVMSLAISDDGRLVTATINAAQHLWELETGKKLALLCGNDEAVRSLLPGVFLSGTNRGATGHKNYPHAMAFDADGQLSSIGREWIRWNLGTRTECLHTPPFLRHNAQAVCWLDAERVAVGGEQLVILQVRDGGTWLEEPRVLAHLGAAHREVTALCLLADGHTLLSGHRSGTVVAWDLRIDLARLPESSHRHAVYFLQASPSGRYVLSRGHDDSVCVWDAEEARPLLEVQLEKPNIREGYCAFDARETRLALGMGQGTVLLYALPGGEALGRLCIEDERNYQSVSALCFGGDPRTLFVGLATAGTFRLRQGEDGSWNQDRLPGYSEGPGDLVLDPAERFLLSRESYALDEDANNWENKAAHLIGYALGDTIERRWAVAGAVGEILDLTLLGPVPAQRSGEALPDGFLCVRRGELQRRDAATGAVVWTFRPAWRLRYISDLQILADGRWCFFASVADEKRGRACVFDPRRGEPVVMHPEPEGARTQAISPDGRLALRTRGPEARVYALASGQVIASFTADTAVRSAVFRPDNGLLFLGDDTGRVHRLSLAVPAELLAAPPAPIIFPDPV